MFFPKPIFHDHILVLNSWSLNTSALFSWLRHALAKVVTRYGVMHVTRIANKDPRILEKSFKIGHLGIDLVANA